LSDRFWSFLICLGLFWSRRAEVPAKYIAPPFRRYRQERTCKEFSSLPEHCGEGFLYVDLPAEPKGLSIATRHTTRDKAEEFTGATRLVPSNSAAIVWLQFISPLISSNAIHGST
jgi:hypothetical protein